MFALVHFIWVAFIAFVAELVEPYTRSGCLIYTCTYDSSDSEADRRAAPVGTGSIQ